MRSLALRLWHSPTFLTWGSLATRLLSVTLVLPLVLVKFAPAEVMVWQLFATIITLQLLLDFGLAPTFSRMLSYTMGGARLHQLADMRKPLSARGQGVDPETFEAVYGSMKWLYTRFGVAILVLMSVGGTLFLLTPIAQSTAPQEAWMAWGVMLCTSITTVWGNAYAAAIQGVNQIAILRRWEIITSLAQIASAFGVLMTGGGLLELVVVNQFWGVMGAWRNRQILLKLHPELRHCRSSKHTPVINALWPAAWRSGLGMLMSQGLIQVSGLIYSQMAAAAEVASYLLALRIITMITQFSQAPFYSKLPTLAAMQAQGKTAEQVALAQRGMAAAYWVFVAGIVPVLFFAQPLLQLIGSQVQFVSAPLWAIMGLAFFIERVGAMHLQLYSLTNHIVWHIANGVTGVLMVILVLLSYETLGIIAFPLAMLLAYGGFYTVYAMAHSRKAYQLRLLSFEARTSVAPALILILSGLMAWLLLPHIQP